MAARLKEIYADHVRARLQEEFGITNPMAVPKIEKVVLNMGMGEAISNAKLLDTAVEELSTITGQKPVVTKAKKSIAGFKLREGNAIGVKVTRGRTMHGFANPARFLRLAAATRAEKITNSVLGMARNRSEEFAPTDLAPLVEQSLVLLEREIRHVVDQQASYYERDLHNRNLGGTPRKPGTDTSRAASGRLLITIHPRPEPSSAARTSSTIPAMRLFALRRKPRRPMSSAESRIF